MQQKYSEQTSKPNTPHTLRESLIQRIRNHPQHAIPFVAFMDACLYDPAFGYYSVSKPKTGKEGDFYTSSSIGSVMGEMIADMFMKWAVEACPHDAPVLLAEWGGGSGKLASHLLNRVKERNPELYAKSELIMVEFSPYHRQLQRAELATHANVRWLSEEEWQAAGKWEHIFVWANELLDAFPVHRVIMHPTGLHEIGVTWDEENESFSEVYLPPADEVWRYMERHRIELLEGQIAELNLRAEKWILQLGQHIGTGCLTVIDYGDVAEELYAPHRMAGTLMCYRRHLASDQPYEYVGEQDMTAHVDFSACQRAAREAGFHDVKLETQMDYLLRAGILEELQEHHDPDPFSEVARRNRAIRQLLLSDQMSELFKVMTACKRQA